MATLTTNYQQIASKEIPGGTYNLTLRLYAKYTEQSISGNYSVVYSKLTIQRVSASYSTDGIVSEITGNVFSGTVSRGYTTIGTSEFELQEDSDTVYHNADGSKSIEIGANYRDTYKNRNTQYISAVTCNLPSIPRQANILSAPNFNDEQNPTITYENPAGNSVTSLQACISLTGSDADVPYRNINKTGDLSYTFNLTASERNTLRSACSSNSRTVYFYVKTVIGGNTYYSRLSRTLSLINYNPTFSDFSYEDVNPTTIALTGDKNKIIKNASNVKVSVSSVQNALPQKNATMSKYRFTCENKSSDFDYSQSGSNTTINGVTSDKFDVYAIDNRGNSTMVTKFADSLINYEPISKGSISVNRSNGVSKSTTLSFNGTWWNGIFRYETESLRNIRVGDDLSGKTLYFDFPDNIHDALYNETVMPFDVTVLETSKNYDNQILDAYGYYSLGSEVYIDVGYNNWVYFAQQNSTTGNWEVINNEETTQCPSDFGTVTDINTSAVSYPYIKISSDEPTPIYNTISATYKYKKTNSNTYVDGTTPLTLTINNNNFSFSGLIAGEDAEGFDINESYDIEVTVTDELSVVTFNIQLVSGIPHIAYAKNGVSIMGKYDDSVGGALQIEGQPVPLKRTFAQMWTNASGTTYYAGPGVNKTIDRWYNYVQDGDFECNPTAGYIKIPAGTSKHIRVGGQVCGSGYGWIQIFIQDSQNNKNTICHNLTQSSGNVYWASSMPNTIVEIDDTQDNYLYMRISGYNGQTFYLNNGFGVDATFMNVEKVD